MALVIGPNAPTEPMAGQAGFDGVEEAAWGPPRNGLSVSVKMGVSVNEGTGMSSERVSRRWRRPHLLSSSRIAAAAGVVAAAFGRDVAAFEVVLELI